MRKRIQKKTLLISLAVLLVLAVSSVIVIAAATAGYSGIPKLGYIVVIDAGHGGRDGGVSGVSGTKEAELNLSVAKKLEKYYKRAGIDVVMTRSNGNGLYGMATKNFKIRDMQERERIIKEARPDLVVSVHMNYFAQAKQRGAQVFYKADNAESLRLATLTRKMLASNIQYCDRETLPGDYYILNCSDYPSILVECGFLSNAEEETLLKTDDYQETLAYNIYLGTMSYLDPY